MIIENAYLHITAGREDEFERAFASGRSILAGAQGCEGVELFQDAEHPSRYLLQASWQRLEDHTEAFPASDAGRQFAELVGGFFAEEPQVRHFRAEVLAARG